ncbi:tRNA(adenine34) deaminase [Labedella gwakjiensis]|uniref:tRNA-specific adenosine deaminase n=2 Tax=Labedella gwakjiensis TaxID=390269 RepID=A0A2P8GSY5_9MICO|nr:tRNA(adenine34) deaminase [Labedella gwakjiensis]
MTVDEQVRAAMSVALSEASSALVTGDVPVGAVVIDADGRTIGLGRNRKEAEHDPTAHAELLAIREAAAATGDWRLEGATLVVTLEPCVMCAGAIVAARVERLVFGAWDDKAGAAGSAFDLVRDRRLNHRVEVFGGVEEEKCSRLLTRFFRGERPLEP